MLQSLLADHFKLIVHRETQEADVYALTLLNADGRLGPGLRHSDLDCEALAVQARREDQEVIAVLRSLDDDVIRIAVVAERALLKAMGGGCRAPVGALAVQVGGILTLLAGAVTPDGRTKHLLRVTHDMDGGQSLARSVSMAARELNGIVPLYNRAVIDTRPDGDDSGRDSIAGNGFRVLRVPGISIESVESNDDLDRARSRIAEYDWVVLTSKRGVAALLDDAKMPPSKVRWAAVGATTATALRERGIDVDCVPTSARGDAIPSAMAKLGSLRGSRVLLARAALTYGQVMKFAVVSA